MTTTALTLPLIERCIAGDDAALARLYGAIARPVLSVATNLLGDPIAAEDVLHDVYIKAVRHLPRWQKQGEVTTWVYRIAVNECLSWRRKLSWRVKRLAQAEAESRGRSAYQGGEERILAKDFLASLDERTRAVVILKYVEGLTFEEIATIVERPVGTLKSVASRALKEGAKRLER